MTRSLRLVPTLAALAALTAADPTAATFNGGSVVEDTSKVISVSALAGSIADADGDPVAVTAVNAVSAKGGSVKLVNGQIIYTPPANFVGNDTITYTVREGVRLATFPTPATLATVSGVTLQNSGFGSALALVPGTTDTFWALTDRGPNIDGSTSIDKIFPVPAFQPNLVKIQIVGSTVNILSTVGLKSDTGAALTGLPTSTSPNPSGGVVDTAKAIDGTTDLGIDANGIDSEGLVVQADGKFWVSDEYGPFLVRFAADGTTEERISPFAANTAGHRMPAVFGARRPNRGMEGLCMTPGGKLVGVMQSPLFNGLSATTNAVNNRVLAVRVLWYDPATGNSKQFIHVLDRATAGGADVAISAVAAIDENNFYVLERDGEFPGNVAALEKKVWKISLTGATDVSTKATSGLVDGTAFSYSEDPIKGLLITATGGAAKTIERVAEDAPKAGSKATRAEVVAALTAVGIVTTNRDATPKLDYATYGGVYTHDKIEGITLAGTTLVTANDDDFGIVNGSGINLASKTIANSNPATTDFNQLLLVDLAKTGVATGQITLTVTSAGDNDAPSISAIADRTIAPNAGLPPIPFTISDPETAADKLTVTATSSNASVIPASGVVLSGTGSTRWINLLPNAWVTGTSAITVTVSDGTNSTSTGFKVRVTQSAYLIPKASGVELRPLLSGGDWVNYKPDGVTPYRFAGLPDGLGAFDNGDGTLTILVNHEFNASAGIARAHGNTGAWVSRWIVDKSSWSPIDGADLNPNNTSIYLWDTATSAFLAGGTTTYDRFCSADLPAVSAFYNAATKLGTQERIFLNGEESSSARAWGHVATGADKGKSWELPHLGKASWENSLACPFAQDKTIVVLGDDSAALGAAGNPSEVFVYVGLKRNTGKDVEKAGLVGGKQFGVQVKNAAGAAIASEDRDTAFGVAKGVSHPFSLIQMGTTGDVSATTAAAQQTDATAKGITVFSRVEDGTWDPSNPKDFYFLTTDRFDSSKFGGTGAATPQVGRSRLWRLRFADLASPETGGTITLIIDGSEDPGPQMMDNLTIDRLGRILIQEDPGGNAFSAKIWLYHTKTSALVEVARHDPARFGDRINGVSSLPVAPFTNDEESSGIIDAGDLLGQGWFLLDVQAHAPVTGDPEMNEYAQLLAMYVPTNVGSSTTGGNQSTDTAYLVPSDAANALNLTIRPLLTVGDSVNLKPDGRTPYRLVGLPDGLGLAGNGDGTFALTVNHEIGTNSAGTPLGSVRAHGSAGAFVSRWTVDGTGRVLSGEDLVNSVRLWSGNAWTPGTTVFNRFCSADLAAPTAFWDGTNGTTARLFLNGEEFASKNATTGVITGGRAFAHVVSGPDRGTAWQLPRFGYQAWENAVANPFKQTKTIVALTDDSAALGNTSEPPCELFIYVGTKQSTGNDVEKAGLNNGKLYAVQVKTAAGAAIASEDRNTAFGVAKGVALPAGLVKLGTDGDVSALDPTAQENDALAKGATAFSRLEDAAWDPSNPRDLYFLTTDQFDSAKNGGTGAATPTVGRSRLWRLRFTDLANPENGGELTMLVDGSEDPGPQMMDNLCVDKRGRVLIQEDPGNNAFSAKIWMYSIANNKLVDLIKHDPKRFGERVGTPPVNTSPVAPFTIDEESSGIIDASELLGANWFLAAVQAHRTPDVDGELVERGQLVAIKVPDAGATAGTPVSSNDEGSKDDDCGLGGGLGLLAAGGALLLSVFGLRNRRKSK
ncbi:hypothetical protein LBMAG53_05310 [Planctomycetota bacterium]|nr:hypothetical protein LBMAG53_05310 [Planctomycetota bacterium]